MNDPICTPCHRLRRIMLDAPWSSYDLLAALIVLGAGLYLLTNPHMFEHIGGVYHAMAAVANEWQWGALFVGCGLLGMAGTLRGRAPAFALMLAGRMATAFCLLTLAGNTILSVPPPMSSVTYLCLAVWSVWSILRTRSYGR